MKGLPCAKMAENVDRRIPLLREVFERFPNTPINIDLKENDDELIEKVYELIVKFNRQDLTVWGNTSNVVTWKCYNVVCYLIYFPFNNYKVMIIL